MFRKEVPKTQSFSIADVGHTIERALASAGLDTSAGPMHGVLDTIRRALGRTASGVPQHHQTPPTQRGEGDVVDVLARVLAPGEPAQAPDDAKVAPPQHPQGTAPGTFTRQRFSNAAGARDYLLYVPAGAARTATEPMPLVVMLHGCTQSAVDFATGTRMNSLAEQHGFLVAYPEQPGTANPSKCWNWFGPADQRRGEGEPSLIAGIVGAVAGEHPVDPRRVFIAGLSAGAAMAVVLARTYPDVFAAVGVHSGLPYASAHDVPSALAAMKGGKGLAAAALDRPMPGAGDRPHGPPTPVIVFHGDRDHTVQTSNADAIVRDARAAYEAAGSRLTPAPASDTTTGGRHATCTRYLDDQQRPLIEQWTLHGAGHAWSGGSPGGTYTDPTGPDASAEMVRFFLESTLTPSSATPPPAAR
jgi:poly(hydroxyalkanoate) depolymerase family esterase